MTGLLVAETIKLTKRRVYLVMVLILMALVGLTGFIFLVLPDLVPEAAEGIPVLGRRDAVVLGMQTVLGQTWFPMILAVIMLGSEVTTSVWGSSLTRESRRHRHVTAKLSVMTVGAWIAAVVVIAVWVALAVARTEGPSGFSNLDWLGVVWKTGLVQLTWVALGLAAVSWLRSTGLAIGLAIALSFGEGLLALWSTFRPVSLSTATSALFGEISADVSGGIGVAVSEPLGFTHAVIVVVGWAMASTVAAYAGLSVRDA